MNRGAISAEVMEKHDVNSALMRQFEVYNDIDRRLVEYGLPEYEIELLLDRYVSKLSLREIAKIHGYVHPQIVERLLRQVTERLNKSDNFKKFLKGEVK